MTPYILALLLFSGEEVTFVTSEKFCFDTLKAHQSGSIVIAWDRAGNQWPAERVSCREPSEEATETPIS